jgi:carbonic anhydrase
MTKLIVNVAAIATMVSLTFASGKGGWSYDGETGPANWGSLDEHNTVCSEGVNQTPINLENFIEAELKDITFDYKAVGKEFLNNGHTVQVNFEKGNTITVEGKIFGLLQYHFHTPSENNILGKSFPMEMHMVHADEAGNLAVVAVMYEEGDENDGLKKILKSLPENGGDKNELKGEVLATDLLPKERAYYRFNGSLTTPPCSENVHWFVMKQSISISKKQLETLEHVMHAPNNRPIQPANARPILQ